MRTIPRVLAAGVVDRFEASGRYFRLMQTSSAVDVEFFKTGRSVYTASGVEAGFYALPDGGFDALQITSALSQTIKIALSDGTGGYDRSQGDVNATAVQASALANVAEVTVGVAEVAALATGAGRKLVIFRAPVSNAGPVALGATGIALATAAIVLQPGDTWRESDAAPAAWVAISDGAGRKLEILTAS
jgi:hypothetical protein